MSLIDFLRVVELAKVFGLATLVVSCWMRVEIAHAEVWTAARLNCSGVNRPVGSRRTGMTDADPKQGNDHKQCNPVYRSTPCRAKYAPLRIAAQAVFRTMHTSSIMIRSGSSEVRHAPAG